MIELDKLDKLEAFMLVRGCELPTFKTQNMKWQQTIHTKLIREFGNKYKTSIQLIVTGATKAVRNNLTGIMFPLDKAIYQKINRDRPTNKLSQKLTRDLVSLMEEKGYLTILKGYWKSKDNKMITCLRFHDKLLKDLDKNSCDKWGVSRLKDLVLVEVVDSKLSTKTNKILKNNMSIRGSREISNQVLFVNKEIEKHLVTYDGKTCVVVYKRRFEDNLKGAGRWYIIGTFQTESSENRNTIRIDNKPTTEQDISRIHPSILATLAGFILPTNYDPYDITPYIKTNIPAKELRSFIKPCFMALLYSDSRNNALHEIREKLWNNKSIAAWLDAETILSSLEEHNFMFKEFFYKKDNWKLCQYLDSEVCTRIMVHFAMKGKVALGYHDSWITKSEDKEELIEVITNSWKEVFGNINNLKIDEEFDNS